MSSYKRYLVLVFFIVYLPLQGLSLKTNFNEDLHILYALEFEKNGRLNEARKLYDKLYLNTKNDEYLIKYLKMSLSTSSFEDIIRVSRKYMNTNISKKELILRIYCVALLNLNKTDEALSIANRLIKIEKSALNYEVLANVYFVKNEFEKALSYFEASYLKNNNENTLFNIVNILYAYLDRKAKAIAYLETHVRMYGCSRPVCSRLVSIYQEQNNIEGIISILKRSYFSFVEEHDDKSAKKTYQLLLAYLEKKDIKEAIKFLEENRVDDLKLASYYKRTNQSQKALKLVKKLYKESSNIDLLAQIAIIEFESAKEKEKVLDSVIKKFEDVLTVLDSHVYQNYLGYILIDFDIDVKKGLGLVEKALEKAPNNLAYQDSKAWGLYKLRRCDEAYKYMNRIVKDIGLKDIEIKLHWNKIKECKKR